MDVRWTYVVVWTAYHLLSVTTEAAGINSYILDYQPLLFNPSRLLEQHNRVRRSIHQFLNWNFEAYNRSFNLELQPASSLFTEDHQLVIDNHIAQPVDTSHIYEGRLAGDPFSSAHISIIEDSISGHITGSDQITYFIEPAKKYFKSSYFHTIIYPHYHVNLHPFRHKREATGFCDGHEIEKLDRMWQPVKVPKKVTLQDIYESTYHNKYSAEANSAHAWSRQKRDLKDNVRTCTMSLQADGLLYQHILDKNGGDIPKATSEIISMFASHIQALNDIYQSTRFVKRDDDKIFFTGVSFQLQSTKIMSNCSNVKPGFCSDNLDVSNFLDLTAEVDHSKFCLVHTFTYRDFVGGTLGLAWVAVPDSPNAGVCGKYADVRDSKNGISKRSLNTGIVTLINFKQDVPPRVSHLTFAHEVGHNFGAQHDTTSECAPYGTNQPNAGNGNYIMFPSATQGNQPNNKQFSVCSKDSIAKVLNTLGGNRNYCFVESNKPFCGNKIVEKGEDCDCGSGSDCTDGCCNMNTCKRANLTVNCSPSEGPCCNSSTCDFIPSNSSYLCLASTECAKNSFCNGFGAKCPEPSSIQNLTLCNRNTKVCIKGECIGSVCERIGWMECFLTEKESTSVEHMCYVSCRKNDSSECISSFDTRKVLANPDFDRLLREINNGSQASSQGVKRPPGSPCNNYKGFCDVFSKCRNVDAEGPFRQLTNLIFSPVTLNIIRTWIEVHWWAVLLMCVGVVVFMGVFVKVFEYNTPSKDPKKKTQAQPASRPQGGAASRPQGGAASRSQAPARSQQPDKRTGGRVTDVPMYNTEGQGYGSGQHGYYNQAYQDSAPGQGQIRDYSRSGSGAQQFDRISRPKY